MYLSEVADRCLQLRVGQQQLTSSRANDAFCQFSVFSCWFAVVAIQQEERLGLGQAGSTKCRGKDVLQAFRDSWTLLGGLPSSSEHRCVILPSSAIMFTGCSMSPSLCSNLPCPFTVLKIKPQAGSLPLENT